MTPAVDDEPAAAYSRWDAARGGWVPLTHGEALFALLEPDPPPVRCACFGHQRMCRRCDALGFLLP